MKALRALGYTIKDACHAIEISRSDYYAQSLLKEVKEVSSARNANLLERIKIIKGEHPF